MAKLRVSCDDPEVSLWVMVYTCHGEPYEVVIRAIEGDNVVVYRGDLTEREVITNPDRVKTIKDILR